MTHHTRDQLIDRLSELAALPDGWYGRGVGEAPTAGAVAVVCGLIKTDAALMAGVGMYPLLDDPGIGLGWDRPDPELIIEVTAAGGVVVFLASDDLKETLIDEAFSSADDAFLKVFRGCFEGRTA